MRGQPNADAADSADLAGLLRQYRIRPKHQHGQNFLADPRILRHELIHALQAERGAAVYDWHGVGLRFNPLTFASGVPAFLEGWPNHDRRLHEREAHWYSDRW